MRSRETSPGSYTPRAVARASAPRPRARPSAPDVYLSPSQLERMTEAQIHDAFSFRPGMCSDLDHNDNTAALDRAVHALIETEMDAQKKAMEDDR